MTGRAEGDWAQCEETRLPTDGAQAWVGMLLVLVSGAVTLPTLGWIGSQFGRVFIH